MLVGSARATRRVGRRKAVSRITRAPCKNRHFLCKAKPRERRHGSKNKKEKNLWEPVKNGMGQKKKKLDLDVCASVRCRERERDALPGERGGMFQSSKRKKEMEMKKRAVVAASAAAGGSGML